MPDITVGWIADNLFSVLLVLAVLWLLTSKKFGPRASYLSHKKKQRADFINQYIFPNRLRTTLKQTYPHLSDADVLIVERGLRNYFELSVLSGKKNLAMPSQAVDVMWHEFILFTQQYQAFCKKSFGRFLHHTPTEAMKKPTQAQSSIKNTWYFACNLENINPKAPTKLPLLFSLDADLNISDGFHYQLDCRSKASGAHKNNYCASHIGCSSGCSSGFDSGDSGFGSSDSGSSCGSGCGGGD